MRSRLRTTFWMVLLAVLFIWVGGLLGGMQGAALAFAITLAVNFIAYFASDKIVLARYRAQPETRRCSGHRRDTRTAGR